MPHRWMVMQHRRHGVRAAGASRCTGCARRAAVPTGWCFTSADVQPAMLRGVQPGMPTVGTGALHTEPRSIALRLPQGNEARSLSSVPCPHPKQRCAATAHQPRLQMPAQTGRHVDSHSTQTFSVHSTQTPALCLPQTMLLHPSLLDLRAGAAPVLEPHLQQRHESPGAARASMATPHPAALDAVDAPAAQAGSNSYVGGNPHGNESGASAPGWRQPAETVSGSCSPRGMPGEAVPQQRLQAQDDEQQHPEWAAQQPSSRSVGGKIPARPASGRAAAHLDTLPAQNRHLRTAAAEAQAERDEAVAQAHGLRREVEQLQCQVDSTHLNLISGRSIFHVDAMHNAASSVPSDACCHRTHCRPGVAV